MAKTKQDYFNAGQADAQVLQYGIHEVCSFERHQTCWQAVAYFSGFDSVLRETKVSVIPYHDKAFGKQTGWVFDDGAHMVFESVIIKRKTHARNYAKRMGWQVIN